jgi:DNA-binding CsgD family transcriptional regulator
MERDAEIRAIERALYRCRTGQGSLVVVDAPPGLGKTALLRYAGEVAARTGVRVLQARAAELERDFAFGVVRQLFEPAVAGASRRPGHLLDGAAATAAALFGAEPAAGGPDGGADASGSSLYPLLNSMYWLLVNLARQTPMALLVDDAHWGDAPSLRFLEFLTRRLDALPATVMISTRTGERGESGLLNDMLARDRVALVQPKNLSEAAVADLVRRRLGSSADEEFCRACHDTTAGNPLFVRELLRVLADDRVQPSRAATQVVRAAGPGALRHHIVARLQRQAPHVQRVAQVLAVLGDDTDLALVGRHADLPMSLVATASDTLVRHGFLEHRSPPAFVHAVVRDAVLALVPPGALGAEHDRAAATLAAAGAPTERVASHVLRTPARGNPARVAVLLRAADDVRRRGAPEGAAVYLRRAREEPPPPAQRSEVSRVLGNCEAYRLDFADAEVHLREAMSLATSPAQRALAAFSLARFRNACGAPDEAVDILLRAGDALPAGEAPDLRARMEAELIGFARVDLHRRSLFTGRLAAFRADPRRIAEVIDAQSSLEAVFRGQPATVAVALARASLAGDRLPADKSAVWVAVHTLLLADRLDEAERHLDRALDFAARRGMLLPVALAHGYLARTAWLRGDLAQARTHVDLGMAAASGQHFALPLLQSTLVHLLVEAGDLVAADAVVASGVLAGDAPARSSLQIWLHDARVRLRTEQGDTSAASADAYRLGRLCRDWGAEHMADVPWRLRAAQAQAGQESGERAAALVTEELRAAQSFGVPRHLALAVLAAARQADGTQARRRTQEAVELLENSPARLELAQALEHLGGLQLRSGDRKESRRSLRRALEIAVECRADSRAERLRARLAAGGGRPPRIHLAGVHALTPSERQVVQLAADRLTNRQIAVRLFVTEKTVETHLSRAYRKLRITSRVELAAQLAATTVDDTRH